MGVRHDRKKSSTRHKFILVRNVLSLLAYSQAIAESVTLGAATSIAGAKAGSALGSALNRSGKQLAGHLQQQLSQSQPTSTPKGKKALLPKSQSHKTSMAQPQSGALVVSVQGAGPNCRQEQSSPQQGKAGTETPSTSCISQNASVKPQATKYKSVVTVTLPN
jgi:hypothetical protein